MRYAQNYLQGQNQARQGQTTRVANQLDRIERKVGRIADGKGELPPPVPPKGESPPSSPSSVSSASTARPITPEAVMGDAIAKQFEDMRRLMATLIGQNNDILHEAEKRRSLEVELSPRGPGLRRIEDLLRRALLHLGDSEIAAELGRESIHDDQTGRYPEPRVLSEEDLDREGSMYPGSEGMYSDEFNPKSKAPANSFTDSYARRRRRPFSAVPSQNLMKTLPCEIYLRKRLLPNISSLMPKFRLISLIAHSGHLRKCRTNTQKTTLTTARSDPRRTHKNSRILFLTDLLSNLTEGHRNTAMKRANEVLCDDCLLRSQSISLLLFDRPVPIHRR